jgi:hypothetical protein
MDRGRWWIFDLPVWRDPAFVAVVVLAVAGAVVGGVLASDARAAVLVYSVVGGFVAVGLTAAVVLGMVRNAVRAYREDERRSG